jgi:hypothetical protein
MCWVKLPRHPGRAHAWPLCGPWPRPHLAASKLVELRSSVNLVAMPHQPLDRPVASLTNPGLRDVRCAHIAPPLGCLGVAALRLPGREAKRRRHHPGLSRGRRVAAAGATGTGSARKARSARWDEEASAWGSSPSRLCVLGAITFSCERPRISSVARSRRSKTLR